MPNRAIARAEDQLRRVLTDNLERFRAFAQSRLGDPELAADVVQDALLKALQAPGRLEAGDNLIAWFYRILRNTIVDLHRKKAPPTQGAGAVRSRLPELRMPVQLPPTQLNRP